MAMARKKNDHAFPELKALLRQRLIAAIAPKNAVDFFAGRGRLLFSVCRGFQAVHAVEKDPAKFAVLKRRAQEQKARSGSGLGVKTYRMNNLEFARAILPGIADVNFMDFDAYGNPHPLIAEVFLHFQVREQTALAITDGGRLSLMRGRRISPGRYLAPGHDNARGLVRSRPLSTLEYELLVRAFWKELANRRGFNIAQFLAFWARGRRVMYYGLIIGPACNPVDQRGPTRSQPLEPEPTPERQAQKA